MEVGDSGGLGGSKQGTAADHMDVIAGIVGLAFGSRQGMGRRCQLQGGGYIGG